MSGDRLAWMSTARDEWKANGSPRVVRLDAETALALIDIVLLAAVVDRSSAKAPWFRQYYRVNDLSAALARLDSGATEGDA